MKPNSKHSMLTTVSHTKEYIHLWHRRFGHRSTNAMAKIVRRVLVFEAILRRSKRLTKGVPPNRLVVNSWTADVSSALEESKSFPQAMHSQDRETKRWWKRCARSSRTERGSWWTSHPAEKQKMEKWSALEQDSLHKDTVNSTGQIMTKCLLQ